MVETINGGAAVNEVTQLILDKINELKEDTNKRLDRIEAKVTPVFVLRERVRNQWYHITALWAVIGGMIYSFYDHIKNAIKN